MLRVVISDSSPLHYLVLIGCAEVLPALYTEVIIPEAVADELQQSATPAVVRRWIANRPSWLQVLPLTTESAAVLVAGLDRGEHDAILLAIRLKADLVLIDDAKEQRKHGASD